MYHYSMLQGLPILSITDQSLNIRKSIISKIELGYDHILYMFLFHIYVNLCRQYLSSLKCVLKYYKFGLWPCYPEHAGSHLISKDQGRCLLCLQESTFPNQDLPIAISGGWLGLRASGSQQAHGHQLSEDYLVTHSFLSILEQRWSLFECFRGYE